MPTLDALNATGAAEFVAALDGIYEHSPWVAEAAAARRPFATVTELAGALQEAVRSAPTDRKLTLLRAHPELGSKVRRADLTAASAFEQGSLGLDRLSDAEFERFQELNRAYGAKFGFPFIICVRRHTRDSILAQFGCRLEGESEGEIEAAISEVGLIARLRLATAVTGPGSLKTDGRLSTHVLDTHAGRPAPGVLIRLWEVGGSARGLLVETRTNADGRTDQPLVSGQPLRMGTYEIEFHVGAHFRARGVALAGPAFLDVVPVRFGIAEPEGHYHVPLTVSPWSYSTYRGS